MSHFILCGHNIYSLQAHEKIQLEEGEAMDPTSGLNRLFEEYSKELLLSGYATFIV